LFADEAVVPSSEGDGALKGLITEPTIPIEAKGVDVVNAENHLHVIMATNNEWAVRAGPDARRYAVFDVSERRQGDHDYFAALVAQMDNGGLAAMLHDLLAQDLSGFHPEKDRPTTEALLRQMDLSMADADMAVHNMLHQGDPPHELVTNRHGCVFVATRLLADAARLDERQYTGLGRALQAAAGSGCKSTRSYIGDGYRRRQYRGFWLPPLDMARQHWQRHIGRTVSWPVDVTNWVVEVAQMEEDSDDNPF
jgi:hypothetical protein